jgi:hypothetical protein
MSWYWNLILEFLPSLFNNTEYLGKIQAEDSTSDVHYGLELRSTGGFSYKINILWEDTGLQLGEKKSKES